jgi:hypothetical protein
LGPVGVSESPPDPHDVSMTTKVMPVMIAEGIRMA